VVARSAAFNTFGLDSVIPPQPAGSTACCRRQAAQGAVGIRRQSALSASGSTAGCRQALRLTQAGSSSSTVPPGRGPRSPTPLTRPLTPPTPLPGAPTRTPHGLRRPGSRVVVCGRWVCRPSQPRQVDLESHGKGLRRFQPTTRTTGLSTFSNAIEHLYGASTDVLRFLPGP